ncbi:MAG: hypothetical protein CMJ77_01660 [Planctomycetaceae bacterium]|nr:hypothetical protein [Planctomycetaceae bacterium]
MPNKCWCDQAVFAGAIAGTQLVSFVGDLAMSESYRSNRCGISFLTFYRSTNLSSSMNSSLAMYRKCNKYAKAGCLQKRSRFIRSHQEFWSSLH